MTKSKQNQNIKQYETSQNTTKTNTKQHKHNK